MIVRWLWRYFARWLEVPVDVDMDALGEWAAELASEVQA